ncbi:Os12g0588000 [Oryza sativa Japonica Group]|uniref:Os12g0588000 protein n=1 Tax=Oryza sativa subsp. japonica TaxID=39947 RepID=C7J9K0_ORYSJ|nr:Os12g0588000 [Oryza sativa Japonica Group]|eukprot:NP_001177033.1 Os12g0588000 [Oryza sativa Japonica Group]
MPLPAGAARLPPEPLCLPARAATERKDSWGLLTPPPTERKYFAEVIDITVIARMLRDHGKPKGCKDANAKPWQAQGHSYHGRRGWAEGQKVNDELMMLSEGKIHCSMSVTPLELKQEVAALVMPTRELTATSFINPILKVDQNKHKIDEKRYMPMQEQHSKRSILGTEAAEDDSLMKSYMLLLSANADSGNLTRVVAAGCRDYCR